MGEPREWRVDGLVFDGAFEEGNVGGVARSGCGNFYDITIAKDCHGTAHERRSSTWFYFAVKDDRDSGPEPSPNRGRRRVKLRISGMNRQGAMYKNGMRPVCRSKEARAEAGGVDCWASLKGEGGWARLKCDVGYKERDGNVADLWWEWHFSPLDEFEFAFCYPYTCAETTAVFDAVIQRCANAPEKGDDSILVHRELLCRSAEGRRVDCITITDAFGATDTDEDCLDEFLEDAPSKDWVYGSGPGWLFPDVVAKREQRPKVFKGKPEVLVSARVHPGETPASFVLDGLLEMLLRPSDPRSKLLRRMFVFRFVPQLNPDGVVRGHYRHDSFGVNLNRVYWPKPDARKHPPQAALMVLARAAAKRNGLALFLDLHAHATKRGVFIYGNALDDEAAHVENQLYALLLSVHSTHFDYNACNFSKAHMLRSDRDEAGGASAEGAARVAAHRFTGVAHCYTLECNYHSGRLTNHVPPARGEGAQRGASPERQATARNDAFTVEAWREVGRALGAALLDVCGCNPWDRVAASRWRSVPTMRQWLQAHPGKCFPAQKTPPRTRSSSPRALPFKENATVASSASAPSRSTSRSASPRPSPRPELSPRASVRAVANKNAPATAPSSAASLRPAASAPASTASASRPAVRPEKAAEPRHPTRPPRKPSHRTLDSRANVSKAVPDQCLPPIAVTKLTRPSGKRRAAAEPFLAPAS